MLLQIDDCVDCLWLLYSGLDYVYLLDHSSGHAKKRTDGLDENTMNVGYDGSQQKQ